MPNITDMLSLRQFAEAVASSKPAVLDAINQGRIEGHRIDSFWLVHKNQVEKYKKMKRNYPKSNGYAEGSKYQGGYQGGYAK